jgi:hypothetical protein
MRKRLGFIIVIMHSWLLTGCIALVVGAGAGAGTFAYVDGKLSRTYQANYKTTYEVCKGILGDMKMPILEEDTDGLQTTIKSQRVDETPMTVTIRIIDPDWTEVSVRTGYVGVWKKEISEQFHEFIAERIKQ